MFFKSTKIPDVTWRSLIVGSFLILPNCYWVVQSEVVWGTTYLTIVSLFFNVTFVLLVLVGLNELLKKLSPKTAFSQSELLIIYLMLSLGSSVAGNNFLENLMLSLGHGFWYATPENEWSKLFFRFVPDWLAVKDRTVLHGFYEGESSIYTTDYLMAWVKPLALWGSFACVLIFTLLCVNILICRAWTEHEKLSYPIIQLPLALTRHDVFSRLFSNRLFLIGLSLTSIVTLLNGFHFHYPELPSLRLRTDIGPLFTDKPFNAVGWMPVVIYPWIVGLTFLIPIDLSFSVWFFYLFAKAQRIIASTVGWGSLPGLPYLHQQTTGGWLGLFLSLSG